MNSFNGGDKIEGLDEFGVWAKATIVGILDSENFRVSFDGFGSMWDRITSKENIRPETVIELPKKRSRQPQIVSLKVSFLVICPRSIIVLFSDSHKGHYVFCYVELLNIHINFIEEFPTRLFNAITV